jgi:uncharacterized protein YbjT (DUF2867 family)
VLVTGGTGRLGPALVDRLVAGDRPVRVASRRLGPPRPGIEYAQADLRSGAGVNAAVAGVEVVVHCATTNGRGDVEMMRNLLAAAVRAGRPHIVYVSIVGVDVIPMFYYRAKLAAERQLAASGLPWTVLRATQFHGLVAQLFDLQHRSPVFLVPAGVRVQPVDVRDLAGRLAEIAAGPGAGRAADFGGPEIHPLRELAAKYAHARGLRRAVLPVHLPGAAARGYRDGGNLAPEHADGRTTFAEHLLISKVST